MILVRKTAKQKILEYVDMSDEPVTPNQIMEATGVKLTTIYFYCTVLTKEGAIKRYRGIRGLFVPKESEQ